MSWHEPLRTTDFTYVVRTHHRARRSYLSIRSVPSSVVLIAARRNINFLAINLVGSTVEISS